MFMVKKTEYTSKTFRIPNELLANLEKLAQENGVSVNNLIIQCCEYAILNINKEDSNDNIILRSQGDM